MSKYQFKESDIYLPGTDIPHNRMDITDPDILHAVESELLQSAFLLRVADMNATTRFDENFFKGLHRQTFCVLYEWAGEYRTVNMSKGGSLFCQADFIAKEAQRIFQQLEQENFLKNATGQDPAQFAKRLAYFQCELIALHPFYELNGRITRLFFDLIAVFNDYDPIDYSQALAEEKDSPNAYILASIECVQAADTSRLKNIILKGLNKPGDTE
jgi:cell filamentation protein